MRELASVVLVLCAAAAHGAISGARGAATDPRPQAPAAERGGGGGGGHDDDRDGEGPWRDRSYSPPLWMHDAHGREVEIE